jgi:hypothetical protein
VRLDVQLVRERVEASGLARIGRVEYIADAVFDAPDARFIRLELDVVGNARCAFDVAEGAGRFDLRRRQEQ